jgi:hypothetical protein
MIRHHKIKQIQQQETNFDFAMFLQVRSENE